jgi:hypothetical protein
LLFDFHRALLRRLRNYLLKTSGRICSGGMSINSETSSTPQPEPVSTGSGFVDLEGFGDARNDKPDWFNRWDSGCGHPRAMRRCRHDRFKRVTAGWIDACYRAPQSVSGDLGGASGQQSSEPGPMVGAMDLGVADHGERASREQAARARSIARFMVDGFQ